jgi:hypothetical protein
MDDSFGYKQAVHTFQSIASIRFPKKMKTELDLVYTGQGEEAMLLSDSLG